MQGKIFSFFFIHGLFFFQVTETEREWSREPETGGASMLQLLSLSFFFPQFFFSFLVRRSDKRIYGKGGKGEGKGREVRGKWGVGVGAKQKGAFKRNMDKHTQHTHTLIHTLTWATGNFLRDLRDGATASAHAGKWHVFFFFVCFFLIF